ncbi:alpha/beta fold hydrolase, partial [Streptomyces sp. MCAF7]
ARGNEGLSALFLQACAEGKFVAAQKLMAGLAAFRPAFGSAAELPEGPPRVTLRQETETAGAELFCFPSFAWQQNLYQYARFAAGFEGRRVSVITLPGFADGEPLPASLEALADVLATTVLRAADGRPFALAGHSAGGSIASVVAARLECDGSPARGLALLDTATWGAPNAMSSPQWMTAVHGALAARQDRIATAGDGEAWVTARACYATFDYAVPELATPTLLVRATEPMAGFRPETDDWRASWHLDHTTVDVPGDHFTMLEAAHAARGARAVDDWLRGHGPCDTHDAQK